MCNYKGQCKSCPIHPHTEEGELVDSYGCLPSYRNMLKWQQETGKVWACHSNPNKVCSGFVGVLNERGIKWNKSSDLITEKTSLEEIYHNLEG